MTACKDVRVRWDFLQLYGVSLIPLTVMLSKYWNWPAGLNLLKWQSGHVQVERCPSQSSASQWSGGSWKNGGQMSDLTGTCPPMRSSNRNYIPKCNMILDSWTYWCCWRSLMTDWMQTDHSSKSGEKHARQTSRWRDEVDEAARSSNSSNNNLNIYSNNNRCPANLCMWGSQSQFLSRASFKERADKARKKQKRKQSKMQPEKTTAIINAKKQTQLQAKMEQHSMCLTSKKIPLQQTAWQPGDKKELPGSYLQSKPTKNNILLLLL